VYMEEADFSSKSICSQLHSMSYSIAYFVISFMFFLSMLLLPLPIGHLYNYSSREITHFCISSRCIIVFCYYGLLVAQKSDSTDSVIIPLFSCMQTIGVKLLVLDCKLDLIDIYLWAQVFYKTVSKK
jgi:hypothetical protein